MKTLNSKMALMALVTFLLALVPKASHAQVSVNYMINNSLNCPVTLAYQPYNGVTPCGTSGSGITVPANGSYQIPASDFNGCGAGNQATNIVITIIHGTGFGQVQGPTANAAGFTSLNAPCITSTARLQWSSGGCTILP